MDGRWWASSSTSRQLSSSGSTRAQGRQQQIVVGHDHLRAHQLLALVVVGALAEGRAVLPCTRRPRPPRGSTPRARAAYPGCRGRHPTRLWPASAPSWNRTGCAPRSRCRGAWRGRRLLPRQTGRLRPPLGLAMACQAVQLELAHIAPAPLASANLKGCGISAANAAGLC